MSEFNIPASWVAAGYGIPTVCTRHGQPAQPRAKVRFVSRPPAWSYVLIVVGFVAFLIVVLVTRKTVTAPAWPFCERCRSWRTRTFGIGFGLVALAVLSFVGGIALSGSDSGSSAAPILVLGSIVVIIVGAVFAALGAWPALAGAQVTGDGMWVRVLRPHQAFAQAGAALQAQAQAPRQPAPQAYLQPQPGWQPAPQGYQQPQPAGYQQPAPQGYQPPQPGGWQPAPPGYQQPAPGYQQSPPGYQVGPAPEGQWQPPNR